MLNQFITAIELMQRSAPDVRIDKMHVNRETIDRLGRELATLDRRNTVPPIWHRFPAIEILGVLIVEEALERAK